MRVPADEIRAIEEDGWRALMGPGGAAFYERTMADDGVMVFPGAVLDKEASIAAIGAAAPWRSYTLDDVRVIGGEDHAVIVYRATAEREGGVPYVALMTSHYARREGRWWLVVHQQTPDPR